MLKKMGTYTPINLPFNRKAIGCKWVYKIKRNPDGTVARYKARLVAKGYTQKKGIDYEETYAPVARACSIRLLTAIAAHEGLVLHQFDVTNAYLNGKIDKQLYMTQPEGFSDDTKKVLLLNKGWHQASRKDMESGSLHTPTHTQLDTIQS